MRMRNILTLLFFIVIAKASASPVVEKKLPLRIFDYSREPDTLSIVTVELMKQYESKWVKPFLDASTPSKLYLNRKLRQEIMHGSEKY